MKKSIAIAAVATIVMSAAAMAANTSSSSDNKVVAGAKKVGMAVAWPFKKVGQGMKAVGNKITGK